MNILKVQFPLRSKIALLVTSLLLLLFVLLNQFVLDQQKNFLIRSLVVKGNSLMDNFTLYCQNAFLTGDELNIEDYVEVLLKDPEIRRIYIILKNSTYFLSSDHHLLGRKYLTPEYIKVNLKESYSIFREGGKVLYQFYKPVYRINLKGERKYLGLAYIDLSTEVVNAKLNSIKIRLLAIFLSLFILGIIGAIVLSIFLVDPIKKLIQGVQVIGNGDLKYKIELHTRDEVENLSNEFNRMTRKLLISQNQVVKQKVIQQELNLAKSILLQIIPSELIPVPGHRLFHYYRPSRYISGDYFNLLKVNRSEYLLIIADVSGKGVPAALLMSILHTVIITLKDHHSSPLDLMKHVNLILSRLLKKGDFITAQLGLLNTRTGHIEIVSAGHEYPLLIDFKHRTIQYIKTTGLPIGVLEKEMFESKLLPGKYKLGKNTMLLFFTDGLRHIKRFPFNNKQLSDFMQGLMDASRNSDIFEDLLMKSVKLKKYKDDLTLLGLKKD